jgi:hypothetical protein
MMSRRYLNDCVVPVGLVRVLLKKVISPFAGSMSHVVMP